MKVRCLLVRSNVKSLSQMGGVLDGFLCFSLQSSISLFIFFVGRQLGFIFVTVDTPDGSKLLGWMVTELLM